MKGFIREVVSFIIRTFLRVKKLSYHLKTIRPYEVIYFDKFKKQENKLFGEKLKANIFYES
jgi:hypothetical protein